MIIPNYLIEGREESTAFAQPHTEAPNVNCSHKSADPQQ